MIQNLLQFKAGGEVHTFGLLHEGFEKGVNTEQLSAEGSKSIIGELQLRKWMVLQVYSAFLTCFLFIYGSIRPK